jgi:hypothetical protein
MNLQVNEGTVLIEGACAMRESSQEKHSWRLEERRKEARYTLILRVAILEQAGKSSFCLVKNISNTGVQLKIYSQPDIDVKTVLRIADEHALEGCIAWIKGDTAGVSFEEELDAPTLLRVQQKLRSNRRRAIPRLSIEAFALLRTGGRTFQATVRDLSSLGARVRTASAIAASDRVFVQLRDLPSIAAYVRWTDGDEAGLVFETPIPMQIIAQWVSERTRAVA